MRSLLGAALALFTVMVSSVAAEDAPTARVGIIPAHWKTVTIDCPLKPKWVWKRVPKYQEKRTPVIELRKVDLTIDVPTGEIGSTVRDDKVQVTTGRDKCGCPIKQDVIKRTKTEGPIGSFKRQKVLDANGKPIQVMKWVRIEDKVEKKCVGFTQERVNVNKGKVRKVPRRIRARPEAVTVVQGAVSQVAPLPGTTRVLSEVDWRSAREQAEAAPVRRRR